MRCLLALLLSAAAEGSLLSLYVFDELKATDQQETPVSVTCHTDYFPENRYMSFNCYDDSVEVLSRKSYDEVVLYNSMYVFFVSMT